MRVRPGVSGYSAHCSPFSLPYKLLLTVVLSLVVSCCLRDVARGLLALAFTASCRLRSLAASLINYSYGRKQGRQMPPWPHASYAPVFERSEPFHLLRLMGVSVPSLHIESTDSMIIYSMTILLNDTHYL